MPRLAGSVGQNVCPGVCHMESWVQSTGDRQRCDDTFGRQVGLAGETLFYGLNCVPLQKTC